MMGIEDSKRYQFLKTITSKKKNLSFIACPKFVFSNTKNHKEDFEVRKKKDFNFFTFIFCTISKKLHPILKGFFFAKYIQCFVVAPPKKVVESFS